MKIEIISGTDRPQSKSLSFSQYLARAYAEQGVDTGITNLIDFPLQDVVGGVYGNEPQSIIDFREPLIEADGLIFVIPEYNGSFPGILKMFIDYLPYPLPFNNKPICLIGIAGGAFGGLRPVEQFQMVVGYGNALVFPERVFIERFDSEFDSEEGLSDPMKKQLLDSQITNFIGFVKRNVSTQS